MNIFRFRLTCALAFAVSALAGTATSAQAQTPPSLPDSLHQRAQRLMREGDAVRATALLDSLVRSTREGSNARAQALYWRATLVADSAVASNDLLSIIIDHPLSSYAADALLRMGQAEYARGARSAAVKHFERLVLEYRASEAAPDGWFWLGLARIANNDLPNGCIALDSARRRIPESNVELQNRVSFVAQPCRSLADARTASADAPPATDTEKTTPPPATGAKTWSAQVGAFNTRADADRVVSQMKTKGHTARVDKIEARYHVRIGSFAKRADAVSLVTRLKREKIDAIVVEAVRREP